MKLLFDSQKLRLCPWRKSKKLTPKSLLGLEYQQLKFHNFTKKVEFLTFFGEKRQKKFFHTF